MENSGRILSDVSKRELIVEGFSELERIKEIQERDGKTLFQATSLGGDIYKIEIIKRVGSFAKSGGKVQRGLTAEISIKDMDQFQALLQAYMKIILDERIDKSIRKEHLTTFMAEAELQTSFELEG